MNWQQIRMSNQANLVMNQTEPSKTWGDDEPLLIEYVQIQPWSHRFINEAKKGNL